LVLAFVASACTAYAQPVGTVVVTSGVPVYGYEAYPHTVYEGRTVYWVDNRWGYPRHGGWVYYQNEPPELVRYRSRVHTAPPAPRGGYGYPPAPYYGPPAVPGPPPPRYP
jgi:hypothetical protein